MTGEGLDEDGWGCYRWAKLAGGGRASFFIFSRGNFIVLCPVWAVTPRGVEFSLHMKRGVVAGTPKNLTRRRSLAPGPSRERLSDKTDTSCVLVVCSREGS